MTPDRQKRLITDIEADLINCLLEAPKLDYPCKLDYPWNPADPDTADYYTKLDGELRLTAVRSVGFPQFDRDRSSHKYEFISGWQFRD
jgi:hypothetical protein